MADAKPTIKANQTKLDSEERYQAFIRNSNEGIWRFEVDEPIPVDLPPDEQIRLMYRYAYLAEANEAMAAMYGLSSVADIVGARLGDFLIEHDPQNTAYLNAFIDSGYRLAGAESHETDKDGHEKFFVNSLVGIVENGCLVRAWGTQADITERRAAALALQKSEERLALALDASQTGMWEWDIATDELIWSDQLKKLYGLEPSDDITYKKYQALLHPEDRPLMQQTIAESMKTGKAYSVEHRIIWPDKSMHWVQGQGKAYLEDGKAVRMVGTSISIDQSRRAAELEDLNRKLQIQSDELVALNNSKDEFISLASHQLRTPATGVKQYIGMLLEGYGGKLNKQQIHMLRTAYDSNERQLTIIDDLLKVAHVDAGRVTLRKHRTNLVKMLEDIIDEQSEAFKRKKQTIDFTHPSKSVYAHIDPERMRMVLENLIDNARKYTGEGKSISVSLTQTPKEVTIAIKDQGVGIAKKDMPRLFQKFSRLSNSLSTLVGGTGLGLYWAEKIVRLHEGSITVKSTPRKGSTFTLIIPKRKS